MTDTRQRDVLKENRDRNLSVTVVLMTVFLGSLGTLVVTLIKGILDAQSQPTTGFYTYMFGQVGIFTILMVIAVQSMIFYFRLVSNIRDTDFGIGLSIIVSSVLLILLILVAVAIFPAKFILIPIGTSFLCWKAGQLYYLFRKQNVGTLIQTYFYRIFRTYLLFAGIALVFAIFADFTNRIVPAFDTSQEYVTIERIVGGSSIEKTDRDAILATVHTLKLRSETINAIITIVSGVPIFFILMIVTYVFYRLFYVKGIVMQEVLVELEKHYLPSST